MAIQDKNFRLMSIAQYLRSKPKGANFKEILKHLEELHYQESFSNDLASLVVTSLLTKFNICEITIFIYPLTHY